MGGLGQGRVMHGASSGFLSAGVSGRTLRTRLGSSIGRVPWSGGIGARREPQ
jgi:hypothetical protein